MKAIASIALLFFFSTSSFADQPVEVLWAAFYKAAKAEKFDEPVKIYATDAENRKMCFIYKKRVWSFQDGRLTESNHAKVFNVDGINRISYEQGKGGGAFVLWSNEERVLSLGI